MNASAGSVPAPERDGGPSTSSIEAALLDALHREDGIGYLAVVAEAPLVVPVRVEPAAGREVVRPLAVRLADGVTAVPAYTSPDALGAAADGRFDRRVLHLVDLAEHWPDPTWVLAVNLGQPSAGHLPGERLGAMLDRVFAPANEAEEAMTVARRAGDSEQLISALLGAELHVPLLPGGGPSLDITDPEFPWWTEETGDGVVAPVFTSEARLRGRLGIPHGDVGFVIVDVHPLVDAWPNPTWTMVVNPATPMTATLSGAMVARLAERLREVAADPLGVLDPDGEWWSAEPGPDGVALQVVIPHNAVGYYLDAGYDRVAGKVHRCPPPGRRLTPAVLYLRLGLVEPGSPFALTDEAVHVIRWRPVGPRAQEWRDNPQPRTAATALPDGAQLVRVRSDGSEEVLARFEAAGRGWVPSSG